LEVNNPHSSFGWMCYTAQTVTGQHPYPCQGFYNGKAKISRNRKHLIIGGNLIVEAKIDEEPHQLPSGRWVMVFDGLHYYKQP